jgi:hypothetical protein
MFIIDIIFAYNFKKIGKEILKQKRKKIPDLIHKAA